MTWPAVAALALGAGLSISQAAAPACSVRSGATSPAVVELYTSEGCSSCPPADRWLSGVAAQPGVLPLAFHVDYWDRLGWADRYASAQATRRQMQQVGAGASGARFAYTPQVLVMGQDTPNWSSAKPAAQASRFDITLQRDGDRVEAQVRPTDGGSAPASKIAAYWAWTEDGHRSNVRLGENAGRTLTHEAVVRAFDSLPAWAGSQPQRLSWTLPPAEKPGQAVLVITDAASGRPLQGLALRCPAGS